MKPDFIVMLENADNYNQTSRVNESAQRVVAKRNELDNGHYHIKDAVVLSSPGGETEYYLKEYCVHKVSKVKRFFTKKKNKFANEMTTVVGAEQITQDDYIDFMLQAQKGGHEIMICEKKTVSL